MTNTCWHCFALPPDCPAGSVTIFQPLSCSSAGYLHLIALGFWKQIANPLQTNYFLSRCQTVLWSLIQTPIDILKNCSSFALMETFRWEHFSLKLKINRKLIKNSKRHPLLVWTSTSQLWRKNEPTVPSSVRGYELEEVWRSRKGEKSSQAFRKDPNWRKRCLPARGDNCPYALGHIVYYKHVRETNDKISLLSTAFSDACELEVSCALSPQEYNKDSLVI